MNRQRRDVFIRYGIAGAHARVVEQRLRQQAKRRIAGGIALLGVALAAWLIAMVFAPHTALALCLFPAMIGSCIAAAMILVHAHQMQRQACNAAIGAKAEERVAQILAAEAPRRGWIVEHDVAAAHGNIDHVVYRADRRSMVIIETKAYQRLVVDDRLRNAARQAIASAVSFKRETANRTGCAPFVHAIVALPFAPSGRLENILPNERNGVVVVGGEHLLLAEIQLRLNPSIHCAPKRD